MPSFLTYRFREGRSVEQKSGSSVGSAQQRKATWDQLTCCIMFLWMCHQVGVAKSLYIFKYIRQPNTSLHNQMQDEMSRPYSAYTFLRFWKFQPAESCCVRLQCPIIRVSTLSKIQARFKTSAPLQTSEVSFYDSRVRYPSEGSKASSSPPDTGLRNRPFESEFDRALSTENGW